MKFKQSQREEASISETELHIHVKLPFKDSCLICRSYYVCVLQGLVDRPTVQNGVHFSRYSLARISNWEVGKLEKVMYKIFTG